MSDAINVLPRDISLVPQSLYAHAFTGFFGKFEMDSVARLIVTICAPDNIWREFTYRELLLEGEHNEDSVPANYVCEGFELLEQYGWIKSTTNYKYEVVESFITRCKQKSDQRQVVN